MSLSLFHLLIVSDVRIMAIKVKKLQQFENVTLAVAAEAKLAPQDWLERQDVE